MGDLATDGKGIVDFWISSSLLGLAFQTRMDWSEAAGIRAESRIARLAETPFRFRFRVCEEVSELAGRLDIRGGRSRSASSPHPPSSTPSCFLDHHACGPASISITPSTPFGFSYSRAPWSIAGALFYFHSPSMFIGVILPPTSTCQCAFLYFSFSHNSLTSFQSDKTGTSDEPCVPQDPLVVVAFYITAVGLFL